MSMDVEFPIHSLSAPLGDTSNEKIKKLYTVEIINGQID